MKSVTQRISEIKQPYGGYIKPSSFNIINLNDNIDLYENENISPGLVGLAVDYMTRYICSNNKEDSFKISLMGAEIANESKKAYKLLDSIEGLDNISIINACKLCGYDVCYRSGISGFKNVDGINPDNNTIFNIKTMVKRGINFFQLYGPIVKDGITFKGGYTSIISCGDADFITRDTLWDFKVSKSNPTKNHTLQLLVYYLLGMHSYECVFSWIKKIGIFNPRINTVYIYNIDNISNDIIIEVEKNVIGYGSNIKSKSDFMTIADIMKQLGCSRHIVMKYYSEYGLPLRKEKNKYVINKIDYLMWLEKMKALREKEFENTIKLVILVILFLFILFILF